MNWLLNFDKFKIKQKNCQKSFNTLTRWLNFAQRVTLLLTAFIYRGGLCRTSILYQPIPVSSIQLSTHKKVMSFIGFLSNFLRLSPSYTLSTLTLFILLNFEEVSLTQT